MLLPSVILLALVTSRGAANPITSTETYDTIIIGLGSAGTTAASVLSKAGKRVLALEAQNRIGGRVHTVPFGDGIVELGAEWIHGTKNSRVYELAIANNVTVLPQDMVFQIYRSDGTLGDVDPLNDIVTYAFEILDDPPAQPEPVGQFLTRKVKEYIHTKYPKLLEDNDFVEDVLYHIGIAVNSLESSNSWNDVSTQTTYEDLEGYKYTSWHRYGYKTFFEILLNRYNSGPGFPNLDIKLNTEVTQLSWPQDPADEVIVTCKNGATYKAKNVIVTVSLGVLKERHNSLFSPELPQEKVKAIENIAFGLLGKIIMAYEQPWWDTSRNILEFLWKKADRNKLLESKDKWITRSNGLSRPMGSNNTLTLWFTGDDAKVVESLSEDEVKSKTMDLLNRFMSKNITIPEPVAIIRSSWHSNPFTRGSYSFDGVKITEYPDARSKLGEPLVDSSGNPRVLFAGEATEIKHFGTVHGASNTGFREANRLLSIIKNDIKTV